MVVHVPMGDTSALFASMDLQEGMSRFLVGSPELTGLEIRKPRAMKYGAFGNEGMFQIN